MTIRKKEIITKEQENFIVENYLTLSSTKIANVVGCSVSKVCNTWVKHGLKGKTKRVYPIKNERFFQVIDSPIKAYYLGFIASDGCLYKKDSNANNIVKITLQKQDEYILRRFAEEIGTLKPLNYHSGKYVSIEICSNAMFDDLKMLGLSPRKTYGETIPDIHRDLMKYFIRGYMDGDGCISYNQSLNKTNISISGYENNLMKIHDYLLSKNIVSSFVRDKRSYNEGNGSFGSLVLTNNIAKYSFIKHIYDNDNCPVLIRKKKLADKFINEIETQQENKPSYKTAIIYYKYAVQRVS